MPAFPLYKWWAVQIVILDSRLNNTAKVVFARLVERHNTKNGRCDPGEERQAFDLNCEARTIRTALRKLQKLGYIKINRGKGVRGTNAYDIAWPSGKTEYRRAEKQLLSDRKNFSAKPMKKPLNEPLTTKHGRSEEKTSNSTRSHEGLKSACPRKLLEAEVLRSLGHGETTWSRMVGIGEQKWTCIAGRFQTGEISFAEALESLLAEVE